MPLFAQSPAAAHARSAPPEASRYLRLSGLAPVGFDAEACLHLGKPWVACTACRDACPNDCLRLDAARVGLDAASCLACGRCAAACPTGALALEGAPPALPVDAGDEISIACARQAQPAHVHVNCLGGLHENELLAWMAERPGVRFVFADDSSCRQCPSGSKDAEPVRHLRERLQGFLRPSSQISARITVRNPPPSSLPNGNPDNDKWFPSRAERKTNGRRAFFSGLGRVFSGELTRQAGVAEARAAAAATGAARRPIVFSRLATARAWFERLAGPETAGAEVALARVSAGDACRLHGGCARVCPTGALSIHEQGAKRLLAFDPWQCLACGVCAEVCPRHALSFEAVAWRPIGSSLQLLAAREFAPCRRCSDGAAETDDEGLCPSCAKSAALARAGAALFGHRASAREGPPRVALTAPGDGAAGGNGERSKPTPAGTGPPGS